MSSRDTMEFYYDNSVVASIKSSMAPRPGDRISIRKQTWLVDRVTFALDYAEGPPSERVMRCNVELAKP